VQEIKYHAFFIEGASHVLALDFLQDRAAGRANLPWIQSAIRTLRMMRPKSERSPAHAVDLANNIERMARSVYPDFRTTPDDAEHLGRAVGTPADNLAANPAQHPLLFGLDASSSTMSPSATHNPEDVGQLADLTAVDSGWNFDFATADMEAFLSIDPNLAPYQLPTYP
jgi:hypothetical protein